MAGAKYPLAAMLKVRNLHEEQAKREARAAEKRLQEAEEELKKKIAELARYKTWRLEEEDRRYASIFGKPMDATKLGKFREGLTLLKQGEVEREQQIHEAETAVNACKRAIETAKQAVVLARKACMKLEEHKEIWNAAVLKEEERLSDLEMEESTGPARASDES